MCNIQVLINDSKHTNTCLTSVFEYFHSVLNYIRHMLGFPLLERICLAFSSLSRTFAILNYLNIFLFVCKNSPTHKTIWPRQPPAIHQFRSIRRVPPSHMRICDPRIYVVIPSRTTLTCTTKCGFAVENEVDEACSWSHLMIESAGVYIRMCIYGFAFSLSCVDKLYSSSFDCEEKTSNAIHMECTWNSILFLVVFV